MLTVITTTMATATDVDLHVAHHVQPAVEQITVDVQTVFVDVDAVATNAPAVTVTAGSCG